MKSRVALVKGGDRMQNIDSALRLVDGDIRLDGKTNVLVKVNFVSVTNQLAATHADAVRAVLRYVRERYDGRISIGESTIVPALQGFENYGYKGLVEEFGVELVDLNEGDWVEVVVYDSNLNPIRLKYSKAVADSDYRIVVGPPKTHDVVVVTHSIKNLAMGALYYRVKTGSSGAVRGLLRRAYHTLPASVRQSGRVSRVRDTAAEYAGGDKRRMHQGYPVHNANLCLVNREFSPDLSVVDGWVGMEGEGPEAGEPVDWRVALAGTDAVAVDCLTTDLMGFDLEDVGYLWYCWQAGLGAGALDEMEVVGADPESCRRCFRPAANFEAQRQWRDDKVGKLIGF